MIDAKDSTSTRPYLIRALYEWCTDNGFTPYVAVLVDDTVRVPNEYVKDGEIVLNISFDATSQLKLGNDFIEFKARFAGTAREIMVPMSHVIAIYARENGQGMAFPMSVPQGDAKGGAKAITRTDFPPTMVAPLPSGADARVVQLNAVPTEAGAPPKGPGKPPPKPPAGPRPALKRVK
jgi:stringent starvation protein B